MAQILKYNPLRFVREAYIRFIQGLFYAAPKGYWHWEAENDDSDIIICDENPIKTDTLGKRPGITCTRGPVSLYTLGLDDALEYDMRTGAKTKSVLLPGTMSVNCFSRVPLEAEHLSWVVSEHLWTLRDHMRRWGFFDVGRNLGIGSPSPPGALIQNDSGDEWYVVTVTSPFYMNRTSQTTPLSTKVASSIETHLRGELAGRRGQGSVSGYAVYSQTPNSGQNEQPPVGGRVNSAPGTSSIAGHSVATVAHPLNPGVTVVVRAARPGDPIVRQPSIRGRTIPTRQQPVEESSSELQPRIVRT